MTDSIIALLSEMIGVAQVPAPVFPKPPDDNIIKLLNEVLIQATPNLASFKQRELLCTIPSCTTEVVTAAIDVTTYRDNGYERFDSPFAYTIEQVPQVQPYIDTPSTIIASKVWTWVLSVDRTEDGAVHVYRKCMITGHFNWSRDITDILEERLCYERACRVPMVDPYNLADGHRAYINPMRVPLIDREITYMILEVSVEPKQPWIWVERVGSSGGKEFKIERGSRPWSMLVSNIPFLKRGGDRFVFYFEEYVTGTTPAGEATPPSTDLPAAPQQPTEPHQQSHAQEHSSPCTTSITTAVTAVPVARILPAPTSSTSNYSHVSLSVHSRAKQLSREHGARRCDRSTSPHHPLTKRQDGRDRSRSP